MATSLGTYPSYITWKIDLTAMTDVKQVMGGEKVRRIRKALERLEADAPEYQFSVEEVTPAYVEEFVPLYRCHMGAKENGTVFDVAAAMERRRKQGKIYEAISLRHKGELVGGLLYSVNNKTLGVAYRVFPYALPIKLPISCSYIAEKYLLDRALALAKSTILHGRDRNVYGVNSAIGLAEYKIVIGCTPYVSRSAENEFFNLPAASFGQDTLIFFGDEAGQKIRGGKLFVSSAAAASETYAALFRNPNLHIEAVTAS